MTVADQPGLGKTQKSIKVSAAPPVEAFLPPLPRVELQGNGGSARWLALFEKHAELKPATRVAADKGGRGLGPKPGADVVDWLIMETLEQKAAPPAPARAKSATDGGGDLLDALVADHLERAAGPAVAPKDVADAGTDVDGTLQREIDALMTPEKSQDAKPQAKVAGKVAGDSVVEHPPVVEVAVAKDAPAEKPEISAELTQAEMDVLVPKEAVAASSPVEETTVAPEPRGPQHEGGMVDEETVSKLNEAEGVLAEELAQLMAETQDAEKENTPATKEPEATAEVAKAEENPVAAIPVEAEAAQAPVETHAAPSAAKGAGNAEQNAAATSPPVPAGVPPHPVVILLPDPEPEEEAEEGRSKWGVVRMVNDLGLMVAQIFDLPFGWIDVMNKNLLGFAAVLFLMSGVALVTVAWWLGRH